MVNEELYFCPDCLAYMANPALGSKASFLERWAAHIISAMLFFSVLTFIDYFEKDLMMQILIAGFYSLLTLIFYLQAQSPGKYILHLRIIKVTTSKQADMVTVLFREWVGKLISGLPLSLGYVWSLYDPNLQTWHDKLSKTVVVKEIITVKLSEKESAQIIV